MYLRRRIKVTWLVRNNLHHYGWPLSSKHDPLFYLTSLWKGSDVFVSDSAFFTISLSTSLQCLLFQCHYSCAKSFLSWLYTRLYSYPEENWKYIILWRHLKIRKSFSCECDIYLRKIMQTEYWITCEWRRHQHPMCKTVVFFTYGFVTVNIFSFLRLPCYWSCLCYW
jgi:hypothetical protein